MSEQLVSVLGTMTSSVSYTAMYSYLLQQLTTPISLHQLISLILSQWIVDNSQDITEPLAALLHNRDEGGDSLFVAFR